MSDAISNAGHDVANFYGGEGLINWGQVQTDLGNFKNELLGGGYNSFTPTSATVNSGTNQDQINNAYTRSQGGLDSQRSLLDALQQQNGLGNQTNFLAQQQALANQLQMQAMGQGPNPAQAQLAQATQANTANQAALMAGQRGSAANAGLIARQAAMQGSANQQQSAGQAASMGAQQQIAAQQALGGQQAQMQNVAGQQTGNLLNQNTGYNQLAQNQQQMFLNANAAANNANVAMQSNANNVGAQVSMGNQTNNKGILGGVMSGIGAVMGGFAQGGMVPNYADGGAVGPSSSLAQMLSQSTAAASQLANSSMSAPGFTSPTGAPQEDYSKDFNSGSKAGKGISSMFASSGGKVPGKPTVMGNSSKNDTVHAMLSPGEVVVPRTVMQSPNPAEAAKRFVAALLAKQGRAA